MSQEPPISETLGEFRILRELGRGGMGVVYLAHHQGLDRRVALKVMRSQFAADRKLVARFRREYLVHAGLQHPNIVQFLDAGEVDGQTYYAMEFLEADPLDHLIRRVGTTQDRRLIEAVAKGLAQSLVYLHGKEILHRDIKPGNIMIERGSGRVVLMDFGLVKPKDMTQLTRVGKAVGSPRYMSPEMLQGEASGPYTDIWQTGVTLYEVATGKLPFDGEDLTSLAGAILYSDLVPPREVTPLVSPALDALIQNCLAKDLTQRYGSAEEFAHDVQRMTAGLDVRLRPPPAAPVPEGSDPSGVDPRSTPLPDPRTTGSASFSSTRPGLRSSPMKALSGSTTAIPVVPRSRRPWMVASGLSLGMLVLGWMFWSGSVSYQAEEVQIQPGIRSLEVRWKGTPGYPSRVRLSGSKGLEDRIFLGEPKGTSLHRLILDDVDPGRGYQIRIQFPDKSESLAYEVPPIPETLELESRSELVPDGLVLHLTANVPGTAQVQIRTPQGIQEYEGAPEAATQQSIRLPRPGDRLAHESVVVRWKDWSQTHRKDLPDLPGRLRRWSQFANFVRGLPMKSLMGEFRQKLEDGLPDESLEAQVHRWVEWDRIRGVVENLSPEDLSLKEPEEWELYRALRTLHSFDAFRTFHRSKPALFPFAKAAEKLLPLAYPGYEPVPGGRRIMDLEIWKDSSFIPTSGNRQSDMLLAIYADTSNTKSRRKFSSTFDLQRPPDPKGKSALSLQVRNLTHEYAFRFHVNGAPGMDLYHSLESFPGTFWATISGDKDDPRIDQATVWLHLEFPSHLLRLGENRFELSLHSAEGLSPQHLVDAYGMVLYPQAPPRPAQGSIRPVEGVGDRMRREPPPGSLR